MLHFYRSNVGWCWLLGSRSYMKWCIIWLDASIPHMRWCIASRKMIDVHIQIFTSERLRLCPDCAWSALDQRRHWRRVCSSAYSVICTFSVKLRPWTIQTTTFSTGLKLDYIDVGMKSSFLNWYIWPYPSRWNLHKKMKKWNFPLPTATKL